MIIICPDEIKNKYLQTNTIHQYKFYNLQEIKEKIYFKYHDLTLYAITKEFQIKPAIVTEIMKSLYFINENYANKKLQKLFTIYKFLENKNYLERDPNFLNSLTDEIIIEGYPLTKELNKIIDILNTKTKVTYKSLEAKYELKNIYEFSDAESEVRFVAENILELLHEKVDINKIFIMNVQNSYYNIISRVFSLFKIPYQIEKSYNLTSFNITKEFLEFIKTSELKVSELNEYLEYLNNKYHDDQKILEIVKVLNKYFTLNDQLKDLYEIINFELNQIKLPSKKYKNVVKFVKNKNFKDDEYVFAISNNEGLVPKLIKNADYLKDEEKAILNLDLSFELNEINNNYQILQYQNIKNLTLSYKLNDSSGKYTISSILSSLEVLKYTFKNNALNYNNYLYKKEEKYDNSYTKIDFEDLKAYLNNSLNLSYSSMDQFFRCSFRYYLNNILKVEPVLETQATKVGKLFHKVLERTLKNNYENADQIILEETNNYLNSDLKEKFYAKKLTKELKKVIERLQKREEKSDFRNTYFEEYLSIEKNSKLNIKVLGFVDKIMIFNDGINNYVMVVDYKTGTVGTDLTKIKDGFNMQLLVYLYLVKNSKFIKNPVLAGAYIEHILDDLKAAVDGKTYEEIEASANRLEGLTTKNKDVLVHMDKYYDIDSYIKGIKVKNDGEFYNYSKVYTDKEFDILLSYIDDNIKKIINSIEECDFKIDPKRYITAKPSDIVGCEFCPFKEVCYVNAKDIKILKETTYEELMGDNNEVD